MSRMSLIECTFNNQLNTDRSSKIVNVLTLIATPPVAELVLVYIHSKTLKQFTTFTD